MNIVLVISDTFRRDHLGCYGNPWIHTPNLDSLAEKAVVFDRFYAGSFPTVPNRADILTGKYNFAYLGWAPLPRREMTLPHLLAEAGYRTMAVVDTPFYLRNGYGYDRGFQDIIWIRGQRSGPERESVTRDWRYEEDRFAPRTFDAASRWLEQHHYDHPNEEFFLLVDTWDPHEPWDPPGHYVELYREDYDGRPCVRPCYWSWREAGLSEADVEKAQAHYCGEITMVDNWVGRLVERIETLGLLNETAIIFTSDHGHYFGEHGQFGKARSRSESGFEAAQSSFKRSLVTGLATVDFTWYRSPLYDEVTRIPLLIYVPQVEATRLSGLTTSPDLMPTVLELAGADIPEAVQAKSLVSWLRGNPQEVRNAVVTSWPLYDRGDRIRVVDDYVRGVAEPLPSTITDGEWTLIYAREGEPVELYHTRSDPEQKRNVFADRHEIAQDLHREFVALLERIGVAERLLGPRRQLI